MLSGSEKYYDALYSAMGKDYAKEANKVRKLIQQHKKTKGNTLLDVACGTGTHAGFLSKSYDVQGVDLDVEMLKVARKKHPEIHFSQGDMRSFHLARQFDVVTCLFSAIGYMKTKTDLQKAIRNMGRHLLPGGVLLLEPWFTPDQWFPGRVSTLHVNQPDLKVTRMSHSGKRGRVSLLEFQYLIGTPKGIEHLVEHHAFGLFTQQEYMDAFTKVGLAVTYDQEGLFGRGLYIGTKPRETK